MSGPVAAFPEPPGEWRALQQGHRPLLHLVQAHREWMEGLLGGSMPTGIRARLQSITSETAILEATLLWYQDKHREVGQCLGTALKMAEESGDRPHRWARMLSAGSHFTVLAPLTAFAC